MPQRGFVTTAGIPGGGKPPVDYLLLCMIGSLVLSKETLMTVVVLAKVPRCWQGCGLWGNLQQPLSCQKNNKNPTLSVVRELRHIRRLGRRGGSFSGQSLLSSWLGQPGYVGVISGPHLGRGHVNMSILSRLCSLPPHYLHAVVACVEARGGGMQRGGGRGEEHIIILLIITMIVICRCVCQLIVCQVPIGCAKA